MSLRVLILLLTTVLLELGAMALSAFYRVPEWTALDKSHRNYSNPKLVCSAFFRLAQRSILLAFQCVSERLTLRLTTEIRLLYEKLAATGANVRQLSILWSFAERIAESTGMRHRLNCFAEGVGVLLGGVMVSSSFRCAKGNGVHGCTLPKQ